VTDTWLYKLREFETLIGLAAMAVTIVSTWILGVRMRRRMKRALGRSIKNEEELTSLTAWMQVEEEEERKQGGKLS
jgi:hypothetical protein